MDMVESWPVYRTKDSSRDGRVFIVDSQWMVVVTERCVGLNLVGVYQEVEH